ncbi:FHA domain-containing protein [Microbacterium trichothecenolyticum]|uniref:FHA domain protein n=1 Tax=Microbacterium trichothecenolyticum TaxID=69370 RepID=A0A0M2HB63_MICTR|nr:FHA domain-containing protein [Microbacterium trichothecenolyticum]KJL43848.1 FHA domain protein [Microbacterium trichothecenolyticum]
MPTIYAPGTTPVAVTPRGFAVLEPGASASLLARIRSVLADGRGFGGVIEALTGAYGASLTAIPAFAVALADGDGIRVAVRGDFAFDVDAAASERVSGAGVTTWTERVIPGAVRVALTTPGSDTPAEFEIADGIVLASRIEWDAAPAGATSAAGDAPVEPAPGPRRRDVAVPAASEPAPSADAPAAAEAPASPVEPVAAPSSGEPPVRGPWSSRVAVPDVPSSTPAAELIDSTAVPSVVDAETLLPLDSALIPPAAADTVVPSPAAPVAAEDFASTTGYDHLWGATVIRSVEDAAVRPEGEDEDGAPTAPPAGDHDGATISLAQARALREAAGGAGVPIDSTPAPLAPPRPPAPGRIRVSTGQVLLLDRTVVIGRRPRSTRVSGTDLPHLVAVDSPQQDISRSHVELRVEGESIVATDLRTTNGTTLLRQGAEPVRLHPGEGAVVIPGDVLDLGDGITVAIEGLS